MNLHVTVIVPTSVARALQQQAPPAADTLKLQQLLRRITDMTGTTLKPLHPGIRDPELIRYFQLEVPDSETAMTIVDLLRQSPVIEAAYIKPPDEEP